VEPSCYKLVGTERVNNQNQFSYKQFVVLDTMENTLNYIEPEPEEEGEIVNCLPSEIRIKTVQNNEAEKEGEIRDDKDNQVVQQIVNYVTSVLPKKLVWIITLVSSHYFYGKHLR